ncbi:MAG: hypothetical protein ACW972_03370 [Promethearchaeota archaeon]|jgi:hypothetical protein
MEWTYNEFKSLLLEFNDEFTELEVNSRWSNYINHNIINTYIPTIYTCPCGIKLGCLGESNKPSSWALDKHAKTARHKKIMKLINV